MKGQNVIFAVTYLVLSVAVAVIVGVLDLKGGAAFNLAAVIGASFAAAWKFNQEHSRLPTLAEKKAFAWKGVLSAWLVSAALTVAVFLLLVPGPQVWAAITRASSPAFLASAAIAAAFMTAAYYAAIRWSFAWYTKLLNKNTSRVASAATADRAFVHSRVIDAPPEKVFRAFADPKHLMRWWGPDGFTNTFEVFDFRTDGVWRHTMYGPDGTPYKNESFFREIVEAERVVFEHLSDGHHFWMTITFTKQGGKTLVGWQQVFDTAEEKQRIEQFVTPANEQNLDRWQAEVAAMA